MPYPLTLGPLTFDDAIDGDGVQWSWQTLDGWWSGADVVMAAAERGSRPGRVVTAARRSGRSMTLGGLLASREGDGSALWAALTTVESLVAEPDPLVLSLNEGLVRQLDVLRTGPLRASFVGEGPKVCTFQVPLLAPDPRKVGTVVKTATIPGEPATGTTVNDGSTWADVVATVTGAATGPVVIEHQASLGVWETWQWDGTLAGGDVLSVDFARRVVRLNGADAYPQVHPGSLWFQAEPGTATWRWTTASGTGTLVLAYRDTWA